LVILETERLILRRWRESDKSPFARLNADPRVMEFMPKILSVDESNRLIDRIEHFEERGFGLCAVELRRDHSFIGVVGLSTPSFKTAFTPCIEIGWRLSADHWGHGLATEGAQSIVRYALEAKSIQQLVSFTVPNNLRSRGVMQKLGMTWTPKEDFDHPNLPDGHPLRRHVLYRLQSPEPPKGGGG